MDTWRIVIETPSMTFIGVPFQGCLEDAAGPAAGVIKLLATSDRVVPAGECRDILLQLANEPLPNCLDALPAINWASEGGYSVFLEYRSGGSWYSWDEDDGHEDD